jgi:hypothetical protein
MPTTPGVGGVGISDQASDDLRAFLEGSSQPAADYFAEPGAGAAGSQVLWRLQISVGSQAGLHSGMHCPALQPAPVAPSAGAGVPALELAGEASLRTATDAEMNIPAPSGLMSATLLARRLARRP